MKTTTSLLLGIFLAGTAPAADPLTALLQKGLFEEEANQNLEAAIQSYRALVEQFGEGRQTAATAVFRLGECYRKLGRTNDAVAQYRIVLRDYSDQSTLANLSRQNLAGLGSSAAEGVRPGIASNQLAAHEAKLATLKQSMAQIKDEASVQALITTKAIEPDRGLEKLAQQRATVEQELAQLSQTFGPEHPQVRGVKARLEAIAKQMSDRIEGIRAGLQAQAVAEEEVIQMLRQNQDGGRGSTATGAVPSPVITDEEEQQLRRIAVLVRDSPDLINALDAGNLTPLQRAVGLGQVNVVKELLSHQADPNLAPNPHAPPPLHIAARSGHAAVAMELLDRGAQVDRRANDTSTGQSGATALHLAAGGGHRLLAEMLLARGADLNTTNQQGQTPLHRAAGAGHRAVVEMLLAKGASLEARTVGGDTAVLEAAVGGHANIIELLAARGATINYTNRMGVTPLYRAVAGERNQATEALLTAKADPNQRGSHGTALHAAVEARNERAVELLLAAKADPNATNKWGVPPLIYAVNQGMQRAVESLLQAGARPNPPGLTGSPLHTALDRNQTDMVRVLLQYKPDLTVRDAKGFSPFERAVVTAGPETVRQLLEAGADPNAVNPGSGNAPLHWAVQRAVIPLVKVLLEFKAEPNVVNQEFVTPLSFCRDKLVGSTLGQPPNAQFFQMIDLLVPAGAREYFHLGQVISVRQTSRGIARPWFIPDTNGWNRFTLLEVLAGLYADRKAQVVQQFGSPDLRQVQISHHASEPNPPAPTAVDLAAWIKQGRCEEDHVLERGDVVDISEADHPVSAEWEGFDDATRDALTRCLARRIEMVIGQERTTVGLYPEFRAHDSLRSKLRHGNATHNVRSPLPWEEPSGTPPSKAAIKALPGFWLSQVLTSSGLLRLSSDTSRVKVRRTDPASGQRREMPFDLPAFQRAHDPAQDIWLREGDVIEVPEK